jgi:hypothetical protein
MKKTSNTQRRTLNIESSADGFCRETPTEEYRNNKTPPKYDLEDRLLDFAVNIVELTESLPNTRSGNDIAGQLLRCGTSPLSNHGEVDSSLASSVGRWAFDVCLRRFERRFNDSGSNNLTP